MKKMNFTAHLVVIVFSLFYFFSIPICAQNSKIDSLRRHVAVALGEDKVGSMVELSKMLFYNNPKEGIAVGIEALRMSDSMSYELGKCQSLGIIGLNYFAINEMNLAKDYFSRSRIIGINNSFEEEIAKIYKYMGLVYEKEAKYDSALIVFNTELEIWEKQKNEEKIANVWNNIATINLQQGKMDEAAVFLKKAHIYYKQKNDISGLINIEMKLSIIYMETKDLETAQKILSDLLKRAKQIENKKAIGFAYQNLGVLYRLQNKLDKSLENYNNAVLIFEELNDKHQLGGIYTNIGAVYFWQNDINKSLQYHQKALEIALEMNAPSGIYKAYNNLADIYYIKKDYETAEKYFSEAIKIQKEIGKISDLPQSYSGIVKTYTANNKHKEAVEIYKEYLQVNDSIFKMTIDEELNTLKVEFQTEKIKDENLLLQKDGELKEKQLFIQRSMLFAALFFIFLLAGIAIFIYRNRRKLKAMNNILVEKNEEIITQSTMLKNAFEKLVEVNKFKEGLSQMIAHDLKNPLNSLLNIKNTALNNEEENVIKQSSKQMLDMIQDMLDVQKYEETKLKLNIKNAPVLDLLSRAQKETAFALKNKNLIIDIRANQNIIVSCDPEIIHRVLVNLLTNAIKYSPVNSVISIDVTEHNKIVHFTIEDQGEGIPKEYSEKIFEKFVQFNIPKGEKIRSSGLGLTFCKIALESHQQNIRICESDKGAKFCFTLPYVSSLINDSIAHESEKISIELTDEEKTALESLLKELEKTPMFKISQLKNILDSMKLKVPSTNVDKWCRELYMATVNGNQVYFNILITNALNTTHAKKL